MAFQGSKKYPYEADEQRLRNYETYSKLLQSEHFDAFSIQGEAEFTKKYNRLRYIAVNFASLVSKVSADMLFGEGIDFEADKNQEFVEGLDFENKLQTQLLEQSLSNSAMGDGVFKLYVKDGEIKIADVDPNIWFPSFDGGNTREAPSQQELAWIEAWHIDGKLMKFLVREIHTVGKIEMKVYAVKGDKTLTIGSEWDINAYNTKFGTEYEAETETGIEKSTLIHIPNMRLIGSKDYFGTSDYADFWSLLFELNNRMTKTANILDKHSDPILAVPEGVLNEDGTVRKEAWGMFEMGEDGRVPEFITWNASLDNAFKEIDKLVEFLFMVSETSPDVLGMGKGQAESGRALKMRLIRTIAKTKRKQRYYEQGLKEVLEVAQMLSIANKDYGITYKGKKLTVGDIETVNIKWNDGIANDLIEELEIIDKRLANETMTREQAIQQLDGSTEEEAKKVIKEIDDKKADFTPFFNPDNSDNNADNTNNGGQNND